MVSIIILICNCDCNDGDYRYSMMIFSRIWIIDRRQREELYLSAEATWAAVFMLKIALRLPSEPWDQRPGYRSVAEE